MDRAGQYNGALFEGAKDVEFKGRKQADLDAKINGIRTRDDLIAQKRAEIDMLEAENDNDYIELDDMCVDFRQGVEGHKDYGDDCPLYEAMGHVRKSNRKSGLHRSKPTGGENG
jgi:hypothetical protein